MCRAGDQQSSSEISWVLCGWTRHFYSGCFLQQLTQSWGQSPLRKRVFWRIPTLLRIALLLLEIVKAEPIGPSSSRVRGAVLQQRLPVMILTAGCCVRRPGTGMRKPKATVQDPAFLTSQCLAATHPDLRRGIWVARAAQPWLPWLVSRLAFLSNVIVVPVSRGGRCLRRWRTPIFLPTGLAGEANSGPKKSYW